MTGSTIEACTTYLASSCWPSSGSDTARSQRMGSTVGAGCQEETSVFEKGVVGDEWEL